MNVKPIASDFYDLEKVEALAKEAFPPAEYLAPKDIIKMVERGEVDFYGLYDEDLFVGFTVICLFENICYLFFLAVCDKYRSKGYGSQALRILYELYPDKLHVVDFEMTDESAPNNGQRITRKRFYMRNGYRETGKYISYLGVDYEILCRDECFDFETFKKMMKRFNIKEFNPRYFETTNSRV